MLARWRTASSALAVFMGLVPAPLAFAADPSSPWSAWTASPVAVDPASLLPIEREALAVCGAAEAGLRDTARVLLGRRLRGIPLPEADEVAALQRAAGEPHPWARTWMASGRTLDHDAALKSLGTWLGAVSTRPALRRCGAAYGEGSDGTGALVVVAVEALADLTPLPTQARPGEWLTLEVRMRVPAHGAEVLLLGPSGSPRSLPVSFAGGVLRGRFVAERPGAFALQVVADVTGGPRPVLEAMVFAGVDPSDGKATAVAPGEAAAAAGADDADGLSSMIAAARASEGVPPLARDRRLDALARDHAARMARTQRLAHDAGDGDPLDRLRAAGIDVAYAGENVAQAATLALAHRATWASPSHRANLLRARFGRVGVGVVRGDRGEVWITETFASAR